MTRTKLFTLSLRRVTAFAGLLAGAALSAAPAVAGRVTDAAGTPLGNATVFVYTAGPKVGPNPYCPSCYPDCGKSAKSSAEGEFAIAELAPNLVFRLLVVASGYAPKFVPGVEPGTSGLAVALQPRKNTDVPAGQIVRGRVADPQGAPIHGAVVEIDGVALEGGRQHFGGNNDVDPLAVTDEKGEFLLASGSPIVGVLGKLSARGFANRSVQLPTGRVHALTMTEGAILTGRILFNGQPLPNVSVGVTPLDRQAGYYVGNFEIGTDAAGRFTLTNLPPKTDYNLYGKMETVGRYGSIAARPLHLGRDGETTDVGDIVVQHAVRISGRVILEDGAKLPEKSRLLVGRDQVADSLAVDLGPNGEFTVQGIPTGVVTIGPRVPGYKTSAKNSSYEVGNRILVGQVTGDIVGLEMLLDKRDPNEGPIYAASLVRPKRGEEPKNRPLRGVEAAPVPR